MTKHKFKNKKLVGIVALVIGIVMVCYALHYMGILSSDRARVNSASVPFFSSNPVGSAVEGSFKGSILERLSEYDKEVQMLFYGGVVIAIAGAVVLFRTKKRK
jgi:hypothetical protein